MSLKNNITKFIDDWVQATKEQFTGHSVANLLRKNIKEEIEQIVKNSFDSFEVKASVGSGNWANVPWISILNPKITSTTQDGIYPVFLFNADGSGFYLSLNQGTTAPGKKFGKLIAEERASTIKRELLSKFPQLKEWGIQEIDLKAETTLGKSYEKPNISAKFYDRSNLPDEVKLIEDLQELLEIYKNIESFNFEKIWEEEGLIQNISKKDSCNAHGFFLSKPFLLLAGISGTGKTRFVREQAKTSGQFSETYCLTSVRPDWHEPSDLLGYISRLNGAAEYITTDVLQFIAKAWRAIADNGLTIEVQDSEGQGEHLVVKGERGELDQVLPYWLCLDEMNLAPVEQYFADYLSVLETREWCWTDGSFTYSSDALLKSATIKEVADKEKLRRALGFGSEDYSELWGLICQYGLGIPFNLLVAGTVNMDETTHGFSRKVIDRALSFDFGEFFPNDYKDFFSPRYENKRLTYPTDSHAKKEMLSSLPNEYGDKSIAFLSAVNDELKNTPFELAYRALNELLLAVVSYQPQDEQSLQAVWDDFMMCKVLPRIEGDEDKLMGSADAGQNILERLLSVLENQLAGIWNGGRPDLYRETKEDNDEAPLVECRSKKKLNWMKGQLVRGFVSFWP